MLIKIITAASVLTVCNAMPPLHSNREEAQSNLAVSSQSFTREDVPLAYKFQAVHPYSTSKPNPEEPKNNVHSHQRATYNPEETQNNAQWHQRAAFNPEEVQNNAHSHQRAAYNPEEIQNNAHSHQRAAYNPEETQNNAQWHQRAAYNPEETHNKAISHQRAVYSHESAHQTRQPKPQNAQYLRPAHQQFVHHPQNIAKYPLKSSSLQYASIPHSVQDESPRETPYFKPTTREELQKVMVPFRVIIVNPTSPDLDNMRLPDSTLIRAPLAHSLHLSTYQKNPYQTENANNMGMQRIMYPQLLRMFQEHRTTTSVNQHTQLPHLPQNHASSIETAGQNIRQPDHYVRHQSTPQKHHFQTDVPNAYQFVPVKSGNHQHHPDRPYSDDAVQYPAHTQAIFRNNASQQKAEPSENVKITYLYPVAAQRTPVAHR